jgi:hypothetical protein
LPPSAADFGLNVTIAIAIKSAMDECIVTVSDRMGFFNDALPAVDDMTHKDMLISPHWGALFAANNACFAGPIIGRASKLLAERGMKEGLDDVQNAFVDAFCQIRQEHVTREYLSKFGISSVDHFTREGVSTIGRKLFWHLSCKIENDNLGDASFLVYGYDYERMRGDYPERPAHLFEVANPGTLYSLDHLQYSAIGSGASMAMASLSFRPLSHLHSSTNNISSL